MYVNHDLMSSRHEYRWGTVVFSGTPPAQCLWDTISPVGCVALLDAPPPIGCVEKHKAPYGGFEGRNTRAARGRGFADLPPMKIPSLEGSCEKIQDRICPAKSVRRSARSTQVERALRARFELWIPSRDLSRSSQFNFFTAPGHGPSGGNTSHVRSTFFVGFARRDSSGEVGELFGWRLRAYQASQTPAWGRAPDCEVESPGEMSI
jgi:hypothetical protein